MRDDILGITVEYFITIIFYLNFIINWVVSSKIENACNIL